MSVPVGWTSVFQEDLQSMADYQLITDSACDLSANLLAEWGIEMVRLSYIFQDTGEQFLEHGESYTSFYRKMREGKIVKTSSVNGEVFQRTFQPVLEQGKDILYIAFSSGLSATAETGKSVAEALMKQYPGRSIRVVDSLCASAGEGLFVYLAKENRDRGLSLDENADALEADKLHLVHWFTVDDLKYLKRGGRISAATALLGTALNVKPVLHVDDEGHLIKVTQVRGRKKAIRTMAEKLGETIYPGSPIFISHGDCLEDAQLLADILKNEYHVETKLITYVGAVIGAHSGPGTLALFFRGTHR